VPGPSRQGGAGDDRKPSWGLLVKPIGKEDGGIPIVTSEPDGRSEARASRPLKVEALLQILTH